MVRRLLLVALLVVFTLALGPVSKPAQAQAGVADQALGGNLITVTSVEAVEVGSCNADGTRSVTSPDAEITDGTVAARAALGVATFESDFVRDGVVVAGDVPAGETVNLEPGTYEVVTSVANVEELAAELNTLGLETTVTGEDIQNFEVGTQPVTLEECPGGDAGGGGNGGEGGTGGQQPDDLSSLCPFAYEQPVPALAYSEDVGCIVPEGVSSVVGALNAPVFDPETGEQIGVVKDLDPDLTSGDFSVTYGEFCEAFPSSEMEGALGGLTAQEYFEQEANAQEQAILDPNGDGLACTAEDTAFLTGDATGDQYGQQSGEQPTEQPQQPAEQPQQLAEQPAEQPQPDGQVETLPDTGGLTLLLPVVLLSGFGLFGLFVATRRHA